ncbi:protein N-terminal glutamine amidohydrolase [Pelobates fuscus]|uniref:protein N-terminal glutamine amidohydrolase n=1 Tax=Pelobates fuscus TaxID=191477 RepID=UPI002FE4C0B7
MEHGAASSSLLPGRRYCIYTSCYCEENVWKLCEYIRDHHPHILEEFSAVFISNLNKTIPIWEQKNGAVDEPVVWDYHVVLLHASRGQTCIYDLDSVLPFPCSCSMYIHKALRTDLEWNPQYQRRLRVIRADEFLRTFASDRSHMKNARGDWTKPPPNYPYIKTAEASMNLDDFISMNHEVGWGTVYTMADFSKAFGRV